MDGAMGTELIARGLVLPENTARWNLTHPGEVAAVHAAWVAAGARVLVTNTFAAGALEGPERAAAVRAAVGLARAAARDISGLRVLGDLGPVGDRERLRAVCAELAGAGVDALLLESLRTDHEVRDAFEVARLEAPGLPVLVSGVWTGTGDRLPAAVLGSLAVEHGAAAVGVNCTLAPAPLSQVWGALAACGLPRFARPGILGAVAPATWAAAVAGIVDGAAMVGGCCGTTPAHLEALARRLDGR